MLYWQLNEIKCVQVKVLKNNKTKKKHKHTKEHIQLLLLQIQIEKLIKNMKRHCNSI